MITHEIIYENGVNAELTVGLPIYNSKKIAWIALDGLINQIDIDFDWELVVYEEEHENQIFKEIIPNYIEQLISVRCVRVLFISNSEKVNLVDKWIELSQSSSETSSVFLLHAADCYSPKTRLSVTYDVIKNQGFDWYDQTKGYFYSFISDRFFLYDIKSTTNLNMGLKMEYLKTLKPSNLGKGIDNYIFSHCKNVNPNLSRYYDETLYEDSLDTHGLNNISLNRETHFTTLRNIYKYLPDFKIDEVLYQKLTKIDGIKMSIIISTYNNVNFIDECINSIINSYESHKCEILIGIDNCQPTLEHIQNNSYPKNVKFYYFEQNHGPYIVFNTLSQISDSDVIMFFGSDDVMGENMINEMSLNPGNIDFIKPKFVDFKDGTDYTTMEMNKIQYGEGVFSIKKEIFTYLNGFEPWRCAADSDFMGRLYKNKYRLATSRNVVFYRRIHKNSLTQSSETSYFSDLRKEYVTVSKNKKSFDPIPELIVKPYIEVSPKEVLPLVIRQTPISEMYYGESSGEKYGRITQISHRLTSHQFKTEDYVKTSTTPDIQQSLTIRPKQKTNDQTYVSDMKTNKSTNDKIFAKKRR